jgi:hypothetical protein
VISTSLRCSWLRPDSIASRRSLQGDRHAHSTAWQKVSTQWGRIQRPGTKLYCAEAFRCAEKLSLNAECICTWQFGRSQCMFCAQIGIAQHPVTLTTLLHANAPSVSRGLYPAIPGRPAKLEHPRRDSTCFPPCLDDGSLSSTATHKHSAQPNSRTHASS